MWIDLSAGEILIREACQISSTGPLKYGPRQVGSGQVMEHSFPRLENYPDRLRSKAIVPDLAAMLYSATQVRFAQVILLGYLDAASDDSSKPESEFETLEETDC